MPAITPKLKIKSVQYFGGKWVDIQLVGTTFDDAQAEAKKFEEKNHAIFIHAFNNQRVIEGQGGIAVEVLEDWKDNDSLDYMFVCLGGGGMSSGIGCYLKQMAPETKMIGFQPLGSPSMYQSMIQNEPIALDKIETFVDGAAIRTAGSIPYVIRSLTQNILSELGTEIYLIPQGLIATTMIEMYDQEAIILEPAGALSVAGL